MKKLISLLLSVIMITGIVFAVPFTASAAQSVYVEANYVSGDFEYKILSDGTAEIVEYLGSTRNLKIPSSLGGYTVTSIGEGAFFYCWSLRSVEIPDTVTNIGGYAFSGCDYLTQLYIPSSVKSIGEGLFAEGNCLTSIVVDRYNRYYDSREYCNAIIETATNKLVLGCDNSSIPDTVKIIGAYAFSFCQNITEIKIPDSVTTLEEGAFWCCYDLERIDLSDSVTSIGNQAFVDSERLDLYIRNPNCYIDYNAIDFIDRIYGYTGSTAQTYAQENFIDFTSLGIAPPIIYNAEVTNNGIKLTWNKTPGGEKNSYRVFIKDDYSWKTIATVSGSTNTYTDKTAKAGNTYTYTVRSVDSNGNYVSDYDTTGYTVRFLETPTGISFRNTEDGTVIKWTPVERAEKYRIYIKNNGSWSKLADVSDTSFTHTGLTSGKSYTYTVRCVSEDLKTLESGFNSTGFTNLYQKPVAEDLYDYEVLDDNTAMITAYYGSEERVVIPETLGGHSVTVIDCEAFAYCSELKTVVFPETLTTVNGSAFYKSNLTYIEAPDTIISYGLEALSGTPFWVNAPDGPLYVGKVLYAYKGEMPWNCRFEVKEGTLAIAAAAFEGVDYLSEVILPDSVTSIDDYAFYNCRNLSQVIGGNGLTEVGKYAFEYTAWLENNTENPVYIGGVLYQYEDSPTNTSLTIREGTVSIAKQAFAHSDYLSNITFPDSLVSIGDEAFAYCYGLTSIEIPKTVTQIQDQAFNKCYNLEEITILNPNCNISYAYSTLPDYSDPPIDSPMEPPYEKDPEYGTIPKEITIYGYNNSTAQAYATKAGNAFVSLGDAPKVDTPIINKAEVNNSGVKLSWDKVAGGENYSYRVFIKNGSSWKGLATVSGDTNTYTDTTAKAGNSYTYTVRCIDSNNKYVSDYDKTGYTIRVLEAPQITGFENIDGGTVISWNKIEGAQKYRLYVKEEGNWTTLADVSGTSYIHTALEDGTVYTYTIRCVTEDSNTTESGYNSEGFSNLYEEIKVLAGDADLDGELSVLDASLIQMYLVGKKPLEGDALVAADSDGDGEISVLDASLIQMILVGKK